jgi:CHAD domain-containing protein
MSRAAVAVTVRLVPSELAMAFWFKRQQNERKGVRRIVREEVAVALRVIHGTALTDSAVHAVRKSLKRQRALLRCAAPALGHKTARQLDRYVREIARVLAPRRDSDVTRDALKQLDDQARPDERAAIQALSALLNSQSGDTSKLTDEATLQKLRSMLAEFGTRFEAARLKGRGMSPYISGMTQTYREGRKAFKTAYREPADEAFHILRKNVQAHWRHMALLSRAWPSAFDARIALARDISRLLGDDHDLALLKEQSAKLSDHDRGIICKLCDERQQALREKAQARCALLYVERAADFEARMSAVWKFGRSVMPLEAAPNKAGSDAGARKAADNAGSHVGVAAKTP